VRANKPLLHGDITASIIDSFFEVHKELGFGFRKSVQATQPAVPVVAVAVPFQSTVQVPFPENGASVTARCASECDAACDRNLSSRS
jgi:hypothetical protein